MKIFKNKITTIFFSIAFVLVIFLFAIIFSSVSFMDRTIEETTGALSGKSNPIRFNFEKLKSIGIIKD